jgi:hypothetical protein
MKQDHQDHWDKIDFWVNVTKNFFAGIGIAAVVIAIYYVWRTYL